MLRRPSVPLALPAVLAAGILLLDCALPYGFAVHMAYIGVIVSGLWWPSPRHVVFGAVICSALTILGGYSSQAGGRLAFALVNRPQTVALIWITAALVIRHQRITQRAAQLAAVVDATDDAIVGADIEGVVHTWSAGAVRLLGWTPGEMLGRPGWDLVPPECVELTAAMLARARRGERPEPFDTVRLTSDGRRVHVSARISPLRDRNAHVVGVSAILRDIGERRRAEVQANLLREAEQELAHTARVATMAELATSIAHELNQPLAAIVSNGDACLRWLGATPPRLEAAQDSVHHVIDDARRAGLVLERIRSLLRGAAVDVRPLDLNELITETLALVEHHAISRGVSLGSDLARDLPPVRGDRVQLQQVVLNLVLNGVDATREKADGNREVLVRTRRDASTSVTVTVLDSGDGVPPELRARVFDPFYTTKPGGLGMGLSLSRSIIERLGGRLSVGASGGSGGCFELVLPTSDEE